MSHLCSAIHHEDQEIPYHFKQKECGSQSEKNMIASNTACYHMNTQSSAELHPMKHTALDRCKRAED